MLTGTMRGLERDELLEKRVMRRFLDPENRLTRARQSLYLPRR